MTVADQNETLMTDLVLTGCSGWPKWRMSIAALFVVMCSVALLGNGLIILVIISGTQLHNPMYFFLCNLSILDLAITTTVVPQSIAHCLAERPVVSHTLCYTQMITGLIFGTTECFLLMIMAYDRYVAISSPLHYVLIMNRTVCIVLVAFIWTTSLVIIAVPFAVISFKFCGKNIVDHFACEFKAVFKLLCANVSLYQRGTYGVALFVLVVPLCFICFSYGRIVASVLRMRSEGSRMKAFSTCGSHLMVVTMFFGTAIVSYILPQTKETHLSDKIFTGCYALLAPMLNPLIYTLRNKEILGALKRLFNQKK